jgi:calcium-translocating P-type ATPase
VLVAAAAVSVGLSQYLNAIFIFVVLFLNASIGTIQEFSAQRAADALKKMVPQYASVTRDGVTQRISASELVPGDRVSLVSGDKVPADLNLIQSQELLVNESILTGESLASIKQAGANVAPEASLTEQSGKVFAGTIVTHGRAQGDVISTGVHSQIGQIATEVGKKERSKSPLIKRIEGFTVKISYAIAVVIFVLFIVTMIRGASLSDVFLLGVALAVSAIPEGLPAAITVALAIGMRRMSKVNVIVRKLVAVESLGSCTYIASDKTGTLTVNEMTVKQVQLFDGQTFSVSGEGLDMHGEFSPKAEVKDKSKTLSALVSASMLANEAQLVFKDEQWCASGDGVDLAFLVMASKYGFDIQKANVNYPELGRIPYESENSFSASANVIDGKPFIHVKGSAEKILAMCSFSFTGEPLDRLKVEAQANEMARNGYRVMAVARGELPSLKFNAGMALDNLSFIGLLGMIDPLRSEAYEAVSKCRDANIKVAMITGDHPQTALALARQLNICDQTALAVTGNDIGLAAKEGDEALDKLVASSQVFARIEPMQKLLIVQQLIKQGHIVAVTGDGVNDAPALSHAHVGIAMGKRGTDVARESSDLILTDDNFASVVQGIKQGRIVYNNIRKVIFLLISTGAAEITLFILSVIFAYPMPLFPIQLLWLNLVTNGIQDIALAFEPEEGNELKQKPRPPKESIFNRLMLERVAINAIVMGVIAFIVFTSSLNFGFNVDESRNITLLLMVLFENVHVLNSRSESKSIFKQPFFSNPLLLFGMLTAQLIHILAMYTPGLKDILQIEPVTFELWGSLLAIALILIVVDEIHKKMITARRD